MTIGEKIKSLREKQGLTKKELGRRAGLSDRAIALIEARNNCEVKSLEQIAAALEMPAAYFLS